MFRITIPVKFLAVGILTLAINGALAGLGLWVAGTLGDRLAEGTVNSTALSNHQTADMMHDALRADALAAIEAVRRNDPEAIAAVRADLAEHQKLFKQSVDANRQLPLPAPVKKALGSIEAPMKDYFTAADAFITGVFKAGQAEASDFDKFMEIFRRLETEMGAVSKAIEQEVAASQAAGESASSSAQSMMYGALGLAVLASLLVFLYTTGGIVRPLVRISRAMNAVIGSDRAVEIPSATRRDEIGDLARAAKTFQEAFEALKRARAEEQRRREEEAERARRNEALRGLAEAFDRNVSDLLKSATAATDGLGQLARELGENSQQAHDRTAELIASTTRATQSVDAVSSASGELSSAVGEIGRQVSDSRTLSEGAVREVERANDVVEGLAGAAQRIGDVVGLISDIAAQTNLLALNATIEAARAGEAGKGFAVVAAEVKSLANQTAKATEDVSTQVAAIQASSEKVSAVIKQVKTSIANISASATAISAAVEQQGASTQEIARQMAGMTEETKSISSNSTTVAESVDQTETAARALLKASQDLHQLSSAVRMQVDGFLSEVRAA